MAALAVGAVLITAPAEDQAQQGRGSTGGVVLIPILADPVVGHRKTGQMPQARMAPVGARVFLHFMDLFQETLRVAEGEVKLPMIIEMRVLGVLAAAELAGAAPLLQRGR